MTKRISLSETAHGMIRGHLREGMLAIDATLGNGHDTVFLAQCVGEFGHVYGFDIQRQAVQATELRLRQQGMQGRATLFLASHADMVRHIPPDLQGRIQVIMFNLGYLPGADKSIITRTDSTLLALEAACRLLAERGLMTIMAYPGHSGGDQETDGVTQWLDRLDVSQYQSQIVFSQYHQAGAPRLFVIRKSA